MSRGRTDVISFLLFSWVGGGGVHIPKISADNVPYLSTVRHPAPCPTQQTQGRSELESSPEPVADKQSQRLIQTNSCRGECGCRGPQGLGHRAKTTHCDTRHLISKQDGKEDQAVLARVRRPGRQGAIGTEACVHVPGGPGSVTGSFGKIK